MKTTTVRGLLRAQTPVHHGGDERTGNCTMLRRMPYMVDGERRAVPVVSGNSIRGQWRRVVMQDLCELVEYVPTLQIYHTLFAGGVLQSVPGTTARIDRHLRDAVRDWLLPLSILGGGLGNQLIPGKLQVGLVTPLCHELDPYHDEDRQSDIPVAQLLDETFHSRRDDLGFRDDVDPTVQMLYSFEIFAAGTQFNHHFTLRDYSPCEASCVRRMVELWSANATLGGHSATGFGKVESDYEWFDDWPLPEDYVSWVDANKDVVLGALGELEETLQPKPKKGRSGKGQE